MWKRQIIYFIIVLSILTYGIVIVMDYEHVSLNLTYPSFTYRKDFGVCRRQENISKYLPRPSKNFSLHNIAIVEVIDRRKMPIFEVAMSSVNCYALAQNYTYLVLGAEDFAEVCQQESIFFKRHCMVAEVLKDYDYVLYLDADIIVVNPKRRIEEYIDLEADVILYNRFYNFEVAAGSYIVKNTAWSRNFLHGFANYYISLLNVSTDRHKHQMFVRKDNYDFMAYLGEVLIPENTDLLTCMDIFYNTTDYFQMGVFSKCVRRLFEVNSEHIKIYPKGTAWVRDIWLTNSMWSLNDFMLHGCKGRGAVAMTKPKLAGSSRFWYNPYAQSFDLIECAFGDQNNYSNVNDGKKAARNRKRFERNDRPNTYMSNKECYHLLLLFRNTSWNHNNLLITSKEQIESRLHEYAKNMEALNAKVDRKLESGCSPSLIERMIQTAKAYL